MGCAVVIIAVAVGDVRTATIVEFDFETITDIAGVVDGIEVVNGSISDAGLGVADGESQQAGGAAGFYPEAKMACVEKFFCFHFSRIWFLVRNSPQHES